MEPWTLVRLNIGAEHSESTSSRGETCLPFTSEKKVEKMIEQTEKTTSKYT